MFNFNPYQMPVRYEIIHVNGRPGAEALSMAPNSQALVLDDTAPIVWLCQTDGAGYKTCCPFEIKEYHEEKPEDIFKTLEERITKLEEKYESNHQYAE